MIGHLITSELHYSMRRVWTIEVELKKSSSTYSTSGPGTEGKMSHIDSSSCILYSQQFHTTFKLV
jgi:hypothetical protein